MRQGSLAFQMRSADDPQGALVVILDTAVTSWTPSSKEETERHSPEESG